MKRIDVQREKSESIAEFLKNEENQIVVLEKIKEALRVRGEWGRHGLFTALGKRLGFSSAYMGRVLTGRDPLREKSVQKMAEYLVVSPGWLKGESSLSYEAETKWYKEQYKPAMDRVVAGIGAVGRFSEGLTEEELEVKLNAYDQEFPQIYAAMAEVPGKRQQEVAEYVFVRASRYPGFVNPQPAAEE